MPRYARDSVVLSKTETTYGTDAAPTGADNAILTGKPTWKLDINNVERDIVRPYFGAAEELAGTRVCNLSFPVELVGSGAAGTAPAWGPLIAACAMEETVEAGVRVDYTPITNGQSSQSIYYFGSGARHKSLGSRGRLSVGMKQGEIPKLNFSFVGLYGGIAAATPGTVDFDAFEVPDVVLDANSTDIVLGGTVNDTGAPVITGGTAYPSLGLELDFGLEVPLTALVGGESVDVTDRKVTGSLTLDVTAAQEVTFEGAVLANTLTSIAFLHGNTAGKKVLVYLSNVLLRNPQEEELNGRRLIKYDVTGTPEAGNDEVRIVCF